MADWSNILYMDIKIPLRTRTGSGMPGTLSPHHSIFYINIILTCDRDSNTPPSHPSQPSRISCSLDCRLGLTLTPGSDRGKPRDLQRWSTHSSRDQWSWTHPLSLHWVHSMDSILRAGPPVISRESSSQFDSSGSEEWQSIRRWTEGGSGN